MNKFLAVIIFLLCIKTHAQLAVMVSQPKVAAQKVVVQLAMKNELTNEIKSARAICLLLDEHGKMVGQSSKWVIGENKLGLNPKEQAKFNFVITTPRTLAASNLTAKVIFSRITLDGGKMGDVRKDVEIRPADARNK